MAKKEKLDHKCIVCGQLYHACDNCEQVKTYTPWRSICDTHKHYEVYLAIKSYLAKHEPVEKIREELKAKGITKDTYKDWQDGVKKVLDEIFYVAPIAKKQPRKAEHQKAEDTEANDVCPDVIEVVTKG